MERLERTLDQDVVDGRVGSGRDGDWKDPDVVAGRGLEGLDPDGDWKGRRLEGCDDVSRCC